MLLVDVYFNLHKLLWSIRNRSSGRVVSHNRVVFFPEPVDFVVRPSGRSRVIKEQRRNVHAFVRGQNPMLYDDAENWKWFIENAFPGITCPKPVLISYNPFKADHFYEVESEEPVFFASKLVMIAPRGEKPQVWSLPLIKSDPAASSDATD